MATYNVTSGISALNGTCEISGTNCSSYNSTNKGASNTPSNLGGGGTGLNFNVTFPGDPKTYHITAPANGTGFSGNANDGLKRGVESWAATATQIRPHAAGKRH